MIVTPLVASFTSAVLGFSMFIVSLFLVLLILVQRGRGGGLTGALGGPGGQSAFGTKAGDLFTRITSFVALGWITLCAFTMWSLGPDTVVKDLSTAPAVSASPADKAGVNNFINLGGDKKSTAGATTGDAAKNGVELTPATDAATKTETPETPASDSVAPAAAVDKPSVTEPTQSEPAANEPAANEPASVESKTE